MWFSCLKCCPLKGTFGRVGRHFWLSRLAGTGWCCSWHLAGGQQGCCLTPFSTQDSAPQQKSDQTQMTITLRLRDARSLPASPCSKYNVQFACLSLLSPWLLALWGHIIMACWLNKCTAWACHQAQSREGEILKVSYELLSLETGVNLNMKRSFTVRGYTVYLRSNIWDALIQAEPK